MRRPEGRKLPLDAVSASACSCLAGQRCGEEVGGAEGRGGGTAAGAAGQRAGRHGVPARTCAYVRAYACVCASACKREYVRVCLHEQQQHVLYDDSMHARQGKRRGSTAGQHAMMLMAHGQGKRCRETGIAGAL